MAGNKELNDALYRIKSTYQSAYREGLGIENLSKQDESYIHDVIADVLRDLMTAHTQRVLCPILGVPLMTIPEEDEDDELSS